MSTPDDYRLDTSPAAESGLGVDLLVRQDAAENAARFDGDQLFSNAPGAIWSRRAALLAIAGTPLALWWGLHQRDQELQVTDLHTFHLPPEGPKLPAPRGMNFGPDGRLFVLDDIGRVLIYDGVKLLEKWWMPAYSVGRPEGVCVLQDGRIVVADTHYHRLVFFKPDGTVDSYLGSHGETPLKFIYTVAITQDPDGFIYVSEYGGHDRVQKLTPQGEFVLEFGSLGTGPGGFQRPSGMLWRDHQILITDAINNRIQVFSDTGKFEGILADSASSGLHYPYNIGQGPDGALYVIEYGAGRMTVLTADGQVTGRFGREGRERGQFWTPWGLACNSTGQVAIADTGNRRVTLLKLA